MGYIDSMYDVMAMETAMLKSIMEYLKENYQNEIKILDADIPEIKEIPSIKFCDAIELLRGGEGNGKKFDLDPEDEVKLCEYAKEKYGCEFIFVTHFPSSKPPFYAMNSREDPREAYKFDLLFRGLEITSGGQRIHDYDEQVAKMKAQGLDPDDFKSYLESHKYGLPPHGGLGIGLERLLMVMDKQGITIPDFSECTLYIATMGESAKEKAFELAMALRESSFTVETDVVGRGLRAQMKYADKIGAKYSMVLGDNELEQKKAVVKNMNTGKQTEVRLDENFLEDFIIMETTDEDSSVIALGLNKDE